MPIKFKGRERCEEAVRRIRGGETLQQIADDWGISRERVRQLVNKLGYTTRDIKPWTEVCYWDREKLLRSIHEAGGIPPFAKKMKTSDRVVRDAMRMRDISGRDLQILKFKDRFWSKVDKRDEDECWPWTAGKSKLGYGRVWDPIVRKPENASRTAWRLTQNQLIPEGKWILHRCDNPICCNPTHLYAGTPKDNAQDRVRRKT